jgi:hypothetical protein
VSGDRDASDLRAVFAALRADADAAAIPAFEAVLAAAAAARAPRAALAARQRRVWAAAASIALVALLALWSSERTTVPSTLAMPPWETPTDRLVSSLRVSTSGSWTSLPTAGLAPLPLPRSGAPR